MDIANLIDIDNSILLLLNGGESVFVDTLMLTLTSGLTWIPLYIALLFLVIKNNEKWSYILLIISCVGLSLILSGGVSDHIVKDMVARPRPINEPSLYGIISPIRGYQASGYSFFSSHAANTMSVAVFFILLVRSRILGIALVLWAIVNGWTRIYLGVHYPSDVLMGLLCGIFAGTISYLLFMYIYKKISPKITYVSSQYTRMGYSITDIDMVMNVLMLTLAYVMIKSVIIVF